VTQAFDMAHSALVVDHEWDDDEATRRLAAATVRAGRWYRTPDNSDDMKGRWLLVQARRTLRGSSPGYYFEFGLVRHYSLPEVEPLG
jgi:ABC-type nitrate/sulfonate/bicarbonate transport system substrate-binding protein